MNYKLALTKIIYFFIALLFKNDNVCPYCKNIHFEVVFKKIGIIDICHCLLCGLYWTNPIFRFPGFYDTLYSVGADESLVVKVLKPKEFKKILDDGFQNTCKDYSWVINWLKTISKGRKLLEFGSSWGYFLYQAKKNGFEATGVEISKKRRIFGIENLNVKIVSDVVTLISEKEKFDVIVTFHVLEHLLDISNIFRKFYDLLNEGGILVIGVPLLDKSQSGVFRIMGAVHPIGFSEEFFKKNLPKEGFSPKKYNGLFVCEKVNI